MENTAHTKWKSSRLMVAAIVVLIVLETLMLGALYTRTIPHPPVEVALFALGPFIAASIACAVAALILDTTHSRAGTAATGLLLLTALINFGPQKWVDESFSAIWPAVLVAQLAILAIIGEAIARFRRRQDKPTANVQ